MGPSALLWVLVGAATLMISPPTRFAAATPGGGQQRAPTLSDMVLAAHKATGVAVAHQQLQLNGAGVSIAVADTGINYKHRAFGACSKVNQGTDCRVQAGWDFLGNREPADLVGGLAAVPDGDPMECTMNSTHGTQVASVAAGDASYDKQTPWLGVAYKAGIMAYKVTGGCKHKSGAVSTAATMQAIQRATQSKADVINLSWGDFRGGGYADAKYSAILRAAMKSGALISVAAGNNGLMGPFFTEGGVTAQHSLSVASVSIFVNFTETLLRLDRPVLLEGKEVSLLGAFGPTLPPSTNIPAANKLAATQAALGLPVNIVPVSPALACTALTTPKAVLQGQVALVERGECTFQEKATIAAAAGAAAVLVYDATKAETPEDEFVQMNLQTVPPIPIWGLHYADGKALAAAAVAAAGKAKASGSSKQQQQGYLRLLSAKQPGPKPYELLITPSSFSSWGPSVTLDMLPSIAAPGKELLAASGDSFSEVEGTSFACPYVSGALALWKEAYRGRLPPLQLAHQLESCQTGTAAGTPKGPRAPGGVSDVAAAAKAVAIATESAAAVQAGSMEGLRAESAKKPASASGAQSAKPASAAAAAVAPSQQSLRKPLQAAAALRGSTSSSSRAASVASHSLRHLSSSSSKPSSSAPSSSAGRTRVTAIPGAFAAGMPTLQEAAYADFVATAQPVPWHWHPGWAQPLARVGAGMLQVDAAIQNPTVITPTHLLLRSNQASQTLSFKVTNTAPLDITYKLGHQPAAAVLIKDLWFAGDQEDLLFPEAATAVLQVGGQEADRINVAAGQSVTVQVTFKDSESLRARPFVYSGYITLTPVSSKPVQSSKLPKCLQTSITSSSSSGSSLADRAPHNRQLSQQAKAVPLVVPYQGFSQNYTTLPILPSRDTKLYPAEMKDLTGLLHICYADHSNRGAFDPAASLADAAARPSSSSFRGRIRGSSVASSGGNSSSNSSTSTSNDAGPDDQDGSLGRKQVTECQHTPALDSDITKLYLNRIQNGSGVVMASVALLRPALRMSLMLFDTDDCTSNSDRKAASTPPAPAAPAAAAAASSQGSSPVLEVTRNAGRRLMRLLLQKPQQQRSGCKPGSAVGGYKQLVGEVWRYNTPSRDYPGSLWAYYNDRFKGSVTIRDPKTGKVVGTRPVQRDKLYRMQLWVTAPLAAADRAAGEQYKTWKFDIRGGFKFV